MPPPSRKERKTMRRPSGEKSGDQSIAGCVVRRLGSPSPFRLWTQMSTLVPSGRSDAKASKPSRDTVALEVQPLSTVKCVGLGPWDGRPDSDRQDRNTVSKKSARAARTYSRSRFHARFGNRGGRFSENVGV